MALSDPNVILDLETGTKLYMTVHGTGAWSQGIFVGGKPGEYMVVALCSPSEPVRPGLSEGDAITLRYLADGRVFEGKTRFMELVVHPTELLLLELPESVQEKDLRSQKRINCFVAAKIQFEDQNDRIFTGVLKDISKNGCRFVCAMPQDKVEICEKGESMVLRCQFPGIVGEQAAMGTVTNIQEEDGEMSVCIQFSDALWWVPPYE